MANINLVTKQETGSPKTDAGLLMLFAIFLLTLIVLGVVYFYRNSIDNKISDLDTQYTANFEGFTKGNAKAVLDYQDRLTIAGDLVKNSRSIMGDFSAVEKAMVSGVSVDTYQYNNDSGTITLSCNANDYQIIAKQILSFKASGAFSSVLAGESKYETKTKKIIFPVVITIKKQNI